MDASAIYAAVLRRQPGWASEALERRISGAVAAALEQCRGVQLPAEAFAERLSRAAGSSEEAHRLVLEDLLLASACIAGDPVALAWLERRILPSVRPALGRFGGPDVVEELLQQVRERLLLGEPPRLSTYSGEAPLTAWVRVTAVRIGLNEQRGIKPEPASDDLLAAMGAEPELGKAIDRARFEEVFRTAISQLTSRERALLRLYFLDDFTVERIATMYSVNKSTVSRWIAAARGQLFARLRSSLKDDLGLSVDDVRSLIRLVRSRVDVGLSQLLGPAGEIPRNK